VSDPLKLLLDQDTTPESFRTFWPKTEKGGRGLIGKIRPWAGSGRSCMDGTQPTLTDDTGKVILHGSKLQL
jgi:hypothetical protein